MLISILKYIKIHKVLRHVWILTDHHQGEGLYLVKFTELFKTLNLKSWIQSRCSGSNTCGRCTWWPLWCCALDARHHKGHHVNQHSRVIYCWMWSACVGGYQLFNFFFR